MVVADEDAQVGGSSEPFLDPAVVLAPDLTLVDVGLGGVDRDERELKSVELESQARVAGAEGVLEAEVADVPRVVVSRHAHDLLAGKRGQLLLGGWVLVRVALIGQIAGDDDQIGLGGVDLLDRRPQELLAIAAAADVDIR